MFRRERSMRHNLKVVGVVLATMALAACADESAQTQTASIEQFVKYNVDTTIRRHAEDHPLEIARVADGFAGYYCQNGEVIVRTTAPNDLAQRKAIESLLGDELFTGCRSESNRDSSPRLSFVQAKYNFLTLRTWRDAIAEEFPELPGAAGLGIDYVNNRLELAVESDEYLQTTENVNLMSVHGIPADAFKTVNTGRFMPNACPDPSSGTDVNGHCFRPVTAGIRIGTATNGGTSYITNCSITSVNDRYIPQYGYWQSGFVRVWLSS